ncbi:hypothetical protein DORFOR_01056 [Dorea formicigenerans ATCC 27755]|uniref:Uncharacterized protein n=1 Tax=Dorea formicigenerans ATCC 27755 TaxID=411461 RepID=B0G477_9FIRM|nr:hypothetical protein DORFOR_01056 [Dorea formicigenerans ATCC 27755]
MVLLCHSICCYGIFRTFNSSFRLSSHCPCLGLSSTKLPQASH